MEKRIAVEIEGVTPLLMNRYPGEQPSAERPPRGKLTQAHIDARRRKKWETAAYHKDGSFYINPEMVEAAMVSGAKRTRMGNDAKMHLAVANVDVLPLYIPAGNGKWKIASGSLDDYYIPEHVDIRGVVIGKARVDACRPIFRQWRLEFVVRYNAEAWSAEKVRQTLTGVCLGDYRPRFGQFDVVGFKEIK